MVDMPEQDMVQPVSGNLPMPAPEPVRAPEPPPEPQAAPPEPPPQAAPPEPALQYPEVLTGQIINELV